MSSDITLFQGKEARSAQCAPKAGSVSIPHKGKKRDASLEEMLISQKYLLNC